MILTMTKYHENLLRDSPLSLLSIVKLFSSLETKKVQKVRNETFLRITRYHLQFDYMKLLSVITIRQTLALWHSIQAIIATFLIQQKLYRM